MNETVEHALRDWSVDVRAGEQPVPEYDFGFVRSGHVVRRLPRNRLPLVIASVVTMLVIAGAVALHARSTGHQMEKAAASSGDSTSAAVTAPLSDSLRVRLRQSLLTWTAAAGDPNPSNLGYLRTTEARALEAANISSQQGDDAKPVFVLIAHGTFDASRMPGAYHGGRTRKPEPQSIVWISIDATTFSLLDLYVTNIPPNVHAAGQFQRL